MTGEQKRNSPSQLTLKAGFVAPIAKVGMPTRWDVGDRTQQPPDAARAACLWDRSVLADLEDPAVIREIVAVFAQQAKDGLPRLQDAIEREDGAHVHEIAHRLKGSSATVGARRMAALCGAICQATAGGHTDGTGALHLQLVEAWRETSNAIATAVERS